MSLRAPTVRDLRAATLQAGGDEEKREMILFASWRSSARSDLEALTIVDYNRCRPAIFAWSKTTNFNPYDA